MVSYAETNSMVPVCLDTERHGRMVNTPALYLGGPGFKSWFGNLLS
jgi:hypothetical protein